MLETEAAEETAYVSLSFSFGVHRRFCLWFGSPAVTEDTFALFCISIDACMITLIGNTEAHLSYQYPIGKLKT